MLQYFFTLFYQVKMLPLEIRRVLTFVIRCLANNDHDIAHELDQINVQGNQNALRNLEDLAVQKQMVDALRIIRESSQGKMSTLWGFHNKYFSYRLVPLPTRIHTFELALSYTAIIHHRETAFPRFLYFSGHCSGSVKVYRQLDGNFQKNTSPHSLVTQNPNKPMKITSLSSCHATVFSNGQKIWKFAVLPCPHPLLSLIT